MQPGTLVYITARGPMGTVEDMDSLMGFADEVVLEGDRGEYVGTHPTLDDWHFIKFDTAGGARYCPLHEGAFETI